MNLAIAGMGWITPLGSGVDPVWKRLLQGDEARAEKITDQLGDQCYSVFHVPESALARPAAHPRLRRASVISRLAATAGVEAVEAAGATPASQGSQQIARGFASSEGGVIPTTRRARDIVEKGAQAARAVFFPK